MDSLVFTLLNNAIRCFDKRQWNDADLIISKVLKLDQKNFHALQLKGLVLGIKGDHRNACSYFKKAMKINDCDPQLLFNYSKALFEDKNVTQSLLYIEKALKFDKSNPDIWLSYGNCLAYLKKYEEALQAFCTASDLSPTLPQPLINQANILNIYEKYSEAIDIAERAIQINKIIPEAWFGLGISFHGLKQYEKAITFFDKAIELNPNYFNAHINKGATLNELRKYREALESLNTALLINPNISDAWLNYGFSFECLGDQKKAFLSYEKALSFSPDDPQINFNLAKFFLADLNFQEGWKKYSYRFGLKKTKSTYLKTDKKRWNLIDSGKKIYLWGEQGIGDQLLHCSLLGELDNKNVFYIGVRKKLLSLLKRSYPDRNFYALEDLEKLDFFDLHAPLGDLLGMFRNSISDFINQKKFLIADHEKTQLLRKRLSKDRIIIGISWLSNNDEFGVEKSIALEQLKPIINLPNCDFIDLQYGNTTKEREKIFNDIGINIIKFEDIDNFNDIDGLASLINACDYIVTVSNTTAHISGGLGKPTYLLVPSSRGRHWYWHESNFHSLWYPSVRILRQDLSSAWSPAINELHFILRAQLND
jgi:tetratricopeptide (TPR) repeat protein